MASPVAPSDDTLPKKRRKKAQCSTIAYSKNLTHGSASAERRGLEREAPMVSDAFQTSGSSPTHSEKIQPDFVVENHGSVFLLKPLTPSATSWIEEHIGQDNGFQPCFPTVVVEPRYIADIVEGIQNDGLAVSA
jgi:hypothetical protein